MSIKSLDKIRFECKHSRTFRNNTGTNEVYYVEKLGYLVKISKVAKRGFDYSAQNSIKSMLTRNNLEITDIINFKYKVCGFCGRKNYEYKLELEVDHKNRIIHIVRAYYPENRDLYYCFSTPKRRVEDGLGVCRGKSLNPNSVEYLQVTRNLSTREEALAIIHARNTSPFYKENHSSPEEYARFQRDQFYGREPDLVRASLDKIQETRAMNEIGLGMRKSGFSAITKEDGHILRSNGERFFYRYAKQIGIAQYIQTNGFYPNSILCYDFYISHLNKYIEISGLTDEKYLKRITEKQEKFGAIVLKHLRSNRYFEQDCKALLDSLKEEIENANL